MMPSNPALQGQSPWARCAPVSPRSTRRPKPRCEGVPGRFAPEALEQLAALYRYIAVAASPAIAERYTNAIVTYCEGLHTFPLRGSSRDDIRPGLRITNYKGRTVIAFDVSNELVSVIGVFFGGQDYEATLRSTDWDVSE